jgi:hypothetical protein
MSSINPRSRDTPLSSRGSSALHRDGSLLQRQLEHVGVPSITVKGVFNSCAATRQNCPSSLPAYPIAAGLRRELVTHRVHKRCRFHFGEKFRSPADNGVEPAASANGSSDGGAA